MIVIIWQWGWQMTNPVFHHLFSQYKALHDQGLDRTEEARQLFGEMMQYAPPEYQKAAHDIAVELGLMPALPDAYSDSGEPLYKLDAMLERLGLVESDIPDDFWQHAHTGPVHLVQ